MNNYCVICGEVIPEGRMVCPICENAILKIPAGKYSSRELGEKFKELRQCNNT